LNRGTEHDVPSQIWKKRSGRPFHITVTSPVYIQPKVTSFHFPQL
jgi:hypothetical protein